MTQRMSDQMIEQVEAAFEALKTNIDETWAGTDFGSEHGRFLIRDIQQDVINYLRGTAAWAPRDILIGSVAYRVVARDTPQTLREKGHVVTAEMLEYQGGVAQLVVERPDGRRRLAIETEGGEHLLYPSRHRAAER